MKQILLSLFIFAMNVNFLFAQCTTGFAANSGINNVTPSCSSQSLGGISPKEAIRFSVTAGGIYEVSINNVNWDNEEVTVFNESGAYIGGDESTAGGTYTWTSGHTGQVRVVGTRNCITTGGYGWFSGIQSATLTYRKLVPTVNITQGATMPVCGTTTTLTATYTNDANGVSWSKVSGAGSIGATTGVVTGLTPNTSSVFRATVDNVGCVDTDDITIVASDVPTASATAPSCNGVCDGSVDFSSGTEVIAANDVEFFHAFDGTTVSSIFTKDNIGTYTQDDQLTVSASGSSWDKYIYTNQTFTRVEDKTFSFRYFNGDNNWNMIGWHGNGNTSTSRYQNLIYGFYFHSSGLNIYEDGASRGSFAGNVGGGWATETWYDCKIVLKAAGGANYYVRKQGEADYSLIYSSVYSTETNLRLGSTYLRYNDIITDTWIVYNETTPAPTFGLCPGTYDYVVTNAAGCSAEISVVVPAAPSALSLTANATDETCPGDCDGSVALGGSGGTAPYTYAGPSLATDHFSGNDEGLILHLPLDYTTEDISPADQAAGTNNGATFPGDGSADFSASTGISMGTKGAPYLTDATTVSYWIYKNGNSTRQNTFNQAYGGWGTHTVETNGAISWFFGDNGGNGTNYGSHQSPAGTITTGSWIHIACTRDPSTNTYTWYKNGTVINSGTYNATYPVIANQTLSIGHGYTGSAVDGKMSDFRIYNRALSATEVAQIHDRSSHDYIYRSGGGEIDHENGYFKFTNDNYGWDQEMYTAQTYTRVAGVSMQAKVKLNALSSTRAMIGWHDQSTANATATYANLVHAIYFNNAGSLLIYEDASNRGTVGSFSFGVWYDVKIELLTTGAIYSYKLATSSTWITLYTSSYSSQSNLSPGIAHLGLESFYLDNLNITDPMDEISNLCPGTYNYTVIDANGCTASQSAVIGTANTLSTTPTSVSGTATICTGGSTSISASGGTVGSGSVLRWYTGSCGGTLVGTGNSISVSPTSTTTYYVRREGTCNSTSCLNVTVTVVADPTISISGGSSPICSGGSFGTLSSSVSGGTGTQAYQWQVNINGGGWTNIGGNTSTLATGTLTTVGSYQYRCTRSATGVGCNAATSNIITHTVVADPVTPTATKSPNVATVCEGQTLTLTGVTDNGGGTGTCNIEYSVNGGAYSTTAPSVTASVGTNTISIRKNCSGTACDLSGVSTYSWSVVDDPAVPTATKSPNVATVCEGQTLTLTGVTDNGGGTGTCNIEYSINGGAFSTTPASFAATVGTNTIAIRKNCNGSGCDISGVSTYSWNVTQNPTTANAGPDQTSSLTCGSTSVTLAANSPSVGTGLWTVVSGAGGSFSDNTSPTSNFSGTTGTTYVLRWTISNSPCTASSDEVSITFNILPTANAGPDQVGAATCGLTTVTLAGNAPTTGAGIWTVVSGTGGSFGNALSPTSTFSGVAGSTYVLAWTVTNVPCPPASDNVTITFNRNPTTANAGLDQTQAEMCGLDTTVLSGNTPSVGTGTWSILSGTGGSISSPNSASSVFSGTPGETYVLRWTISNGPCTPSTDDVTIKFNIEPTASNPGSDFSACVGLPSTMSANNPTIGTGVWTWSPSNPTYVGGTSASDYNAQVSFATGGVYTGTWTITNAPCTSTEDVNVTVNSAATNVVLVSGTSVTAVEVCVESPWTYYASPSAPDEYIFAIKKNGNVFDANIEVVDQAGTSPIVSTGGAGPDRGTWLINRHWNVTLNSGSISTPVDVRFYVDPAEVSAAESAATAFLGSSPYATTLVGLTFFKTVGTPFNPNMMNSGNFTFTPQYLSHTTGTTNGVTYYELTGLTSFSGGTGGFSVNDDGSTLPVELLEFDVEGVNNDYVSTTWSTATEVNNNGFDLMRSTDGVNFESIAWIPGNGNSTQIHNYQYDDTEVSRGITYYYQLKQVDFNGVFELFDIKSVALSRTEDFKIGEIVPNPSKEQSNIGVAIETFKEEEITISVFNQIGMNVANYTYQLESGTNDVILNTGDLSSGTYFINFEGNFGRVTKRLIIVK